MPSTYTISEGRHATSREPYWFIVKDNKQVPMTFNSPSLAKEFLKVLQEDEARQHVGSKRPTT